MNSFLMDELISNGWTHTYETSLYSCIMGPEDLHKEG